MPGFECADDYQRILSLSLSRTIRYVIASACIAASSGVVAETAYYVFGVGGKPLICIPVSSVPDFAPPEPSLNIQPGDVPFELAILHYNAAQIKSAIPTYYSLPAYAQDSSPNVLSADVSVVDHKYTKMLLGEAAGTDAVDIWNRTGRCKSPVITTVPGTSNSLAKCDSNSFWHILFDQKPSAITTSNNVYRHVLAECTHTSIGFGPHNGQELENCTRRIFIDYFRVDYDFQIENTKVIQKMDAFLKAKEESWKRNCQRSP